MRALQNVALIAGLSVAVACSEPVAAPEAGDLSRVGTDAPPFLPGEQQPTVDVTRRTLAIYPAGVGQILAQTFRPRSNQVLGYVELPVGCAADVLLNIKIRLGLAGRILYEANVSGLPTVSDGSFQLIQVFNPATQRGIRLARGRDYAIELAAFPAPGAVESTCGISQGPTGNSYRGGRGYYQDPINGPDFLPIPAGAPTDDEDLPFITLVR